MQLNQLDKLGLALIYIFNKRGDCGRGRALVVLGQALSALEARRFEKLG